MGELRCYYKPARSKKRVYTAKDVGRIVCYARDDGASDEELRREISKCLSIEDSECSEAFDLLGRAVALLLAWGLALALLKRLFVVVRLLLLLRDLLPKSVVEYLENTPLDKIEQDVRITIDEATELLIKRKGPPPP